MSPLLRAVCLLLISVPALMAHPGHGEHSLAAGLLHPITGIDHLVAMIAVGVLAARLEGAARWWVPASFLLAMLAGGGLALMGLELPLVEPGILLSIVVFGVLITLSAPPNPWVACALVAIFALPHGHAHVAEMGDHQAIGYLGGFLLATAVLHAAGMAGGMALRHASKGALPMRLAGAAVACVGVLLAVVPRG